MFQKKSPFTLVELMIAVAVLTILMTISVISANFVWAKINHSRTETSLAILTASINDFYQKNKRWPNVFEDYTKHQSENEVNSSPLKSRTPAHALVFIYGEGYEKDDPNKIQKRGLWEMPIGSGSRQDQKLVIPEGDWKRAEGALNFKNKKISTRIADKSQARPVRDMWNDVIVVRLSKEMQSKLVNYGITMQRLEYENTRNTGTFDLFSLGEDGVEYDETKMELTNDDVWPQN